MGTITTILLCMFLLVSCAPDNAKSLPADWPIPKLTLPTGATISGDVLTPETNPSGGWVVSFVWDGSDKELAKHVESCLGPLDYMKITIKQPPPGYDEDPVPAYFSPDNRTRLLVTLVETDGKRVYDITQTDNNIKIVKGYKKSGMAKLEQL